MIDEIEKEKLINFGAALDALKHGFKVARQGWNGKGMWLALIGKSDWMLEEGALHPDLPELSDWIGMKTADNKFVPWLASQTDVLAEDWVIVE